MVHEFRRAQEDAIVIELKVTRKELEEADPNDPNSIFKLFVGKLVAQLKEINKPRVTLETK